MKAILVLFVLSSFGNFAHARIHSEEGPQAAICISTLLSLKPKLSAHVNQVDKTINALKASWQSQSQPGSSIDTYLAVKRETYRLFDLIDVSSGLKINAACELERHPCWRVVNGMPMNNFNESEKSALLFYIEKYGETYPELDAKPTDVYTLYLKQAYEAGLNKKLHWQLQKDFSVACRLTHLYPLTE